MYYLKLTPAQVRAMSDWDWALAWQSVQWVRKEEAKAQKNAFS